MTKRIAIIGTGISGLVSAYLLNKHYDISVFEASDYIGGHTHTVPLDVNGRRYFVDTGFIVFNKRTYPFFCQLLEKLNVAIQPSEMSFSYRSDQRKFEYNGHNLNTLFSDRLNLINPKFYLFIKEILRFNANAKKFLLDTERNPMTVKEFIEHYQYSELFVDCYLIPMIASIWSKKKDDTLNCNAYFIFNFYFNHGLLDTFNRPQWYVLANGSHSYVPKLIEKFKDKIFLNQKVNKIERLSDKVILKTETGEHTFEFVVIATHSDDALKLISRPTHEECDILSAIPYTENEVVLHTDTMLMPKSRRAWASWNYFDNKSSLPTLTYYMNRLQSLDAPEHFFVSTNLVNYIDKNKIIQKFNYAHPCLNQNAVIAQKKFDLINGKNNTYYAGSYWGNGFHEDGVKSAIKMCGSLGISL